MEISENTLIFHGDLFYVCLIINGASFLKEHIMMIVVDMIFKMMHQSNLKEIYKNFNKTSITCMTMETLISTSYLECLT